MKNNITMPEVSCLPGGSGSDFIRTFALPQNIEEAVEHLIMIIFTKSMLVLLEIRQMINTSLMF